MRRSLLYIASAVGVACATVVTTLVIKADLPAGETAGKIGLAWAPLTIILATVFARKPAQEGTKS